MTVDNIIEIQKGPSGIYDLLLKERNGHRFINIIIGEAEAIAISNAWTGRKSLRPLTHDLLFSLLQVSGMEVVKIVIYKIEQQIFYSHLYLKRGNQLFRADSRTSDAVTLALQFKAPIYIYEDELVREIEREQSDFFFSRDDQEESFSRVEVLNKKLQEAIEEEDYEQAAMLRDEINKLKLNQ